MAAGNDEKRLQNLQAIAKMDPSYKQTISYQKAVAKLTKKKDSGTDAPVVKSSEQIHTPFGSFSPGETPYEQITSGTGEIGRSVQQQKERLAITQQFAPQEFEAALRSSPSQYPAAYKAAAETAVQRKMTQQNVPLMVQSGLGDLLQSGLIIQKADVTGYDPGGKPTYGEPYMVLSDKGRGLGKERIYELEQGAIWGKSFDIIFGDDDVLYVYPEGTRTAIREAGFDTPVYLSKGGQDYLVLQKEGKDTITVAGADSITHRLTAPQKEPFKEFLDLQEYDVTPTAKFDYSFRGTDFDIKAEGIQRRVPDYSDYFSGFRPTPLPGSLSPATPRKDELMWRDTPLTGFYQHRGAEELAEPLRQFERSIGAEIPVPFGGSYPLGEGTTVDIPHKIGVISTVPYLVAGGVEITLKSGVAFGDLLFKAGTLAVKGGQLTKAEREVMGSELVASGGYLLAAPLVATLVAKGALTPVAKGALTPTTAFKPPASQPRLKLQSVSMKGGVPVEEYNLFTLTRYHADSRQFFSKMAAAGPKLPSFSPSQTMSDAVTGGKSLYFLAGAEKTALKQIAAGGGPSSLYATMTLSGLNPFVLVKPPAAKTMQPQVLPPIPAAKSMSFITTKRQPQVLERVSVRQATLQMPKMLRMIPAVGATKLAGDLTGRPYPKTSPRAIEGIEADIVYEMGRTKSEQVAAIREAAKTGFSWRYSQRVGTGLRTGVGQMTGIGLRVDPRVGVMPKWATGIRLKVGILTKTALRLRPPTPKPPAVPGLPAGMFGPPRKFFTGTTEPKKTKKRRRDYTPSLIGLGMAPQKVDTKRVFSGLEIRPLPKRGKGKR